MNYYGGKELSAAFQTVRKNTIRVAEDIPEEKYNFRAAPDARSVGELLTHIALSTNFPQEIHGKQKLKTLAGVDFPAFLQKMTAEEKKPRTKAQIVELLRENGKSFAGFLDNLSDEFLGESVSLPPGANPASRVRFDMLLSAKEHEMHHRGQLMLIERIVGIVPHLTRERQARFGSATSTTAKN